MSKILCRRTVAALLDVRH